MPIAAKAAEAYQTIRPEIEIKISGGGSGNGIKAIIDGATDIGNSSRFIKDKEIRYAYAKGAYPVPFRIAYDCIIPIVNPQNKIDTLTLQQLKNISSGTYEVWEKRVMAETPVFPGAQVEPSNEDVVKAVAADPNAIGYIGLGYLRPGVKAIRVNQIKGSVETTRDHTYPISRPLFMFTSGWPEGELLGFLNFILQPDKGQKIVSAGGFVALYENISSPLETASNIKRVQLYLNALGYAAGPVDGIKGPLTLAGMAAFQKAHALPLQPRISVQMLSLLLKK
jgi:phosphate transport system substrate-binding protein